MITLRPLQEPVIDELRSKLREFKSVILCAPCGFGKTTISSYILHGSASRGNRSYFCVHRRQLIFQVQEALDKQEIPHGVIAARYKFIDELVQICMQQSYIRRKVLPAKLLVIDECHLQPDTYKQIIALNPDAYVIGLSATPELLSGKPLDAFKAIVYAPDTEALINAGYLTNYKYYAPTDMDFSKVRSRGGDYREEEVAAIVEKSQIIGSSIEHYETYGEGGRFLNFSYNVKHSIETAEAFTKAGYPCVHVDAETDDDTRKEVMKKLVRKEIAGISNCNLYCEGTDLPVLEVIIKQRPTKSRMRNRQIDGRVMRTADGKKYGIIIDMVNNWKVLQSLPDTPHEWSWQGISKKEKKKERLDSLSNCSKCFAVVKSGVEVCECGAVILRKVRTIEQKAGELTKIEKDMIKLEQKKEKWACKTLEDFIAYGIKHQYKPGWAMIQWNLRNQKRKY